MILKHNPRLKPGKITVEHVLFEEAGIDKYGYPISARDSNGDPIVKDVVTYKLPYLKDEVLSIMSWMETADLKKKLA